MTELLKGSIPLFHKVFRVLFIFVLLFLPFVRGGVHLWSFSAAVLILSLSFLWEVLASKNLYPVFSVHTDVDLFLGIYVFFFFVSTLFSKLPYLSVVEMYKLISLLVIFWGALHFCRDRSGIRELASALAFLGGTLSIIGLLQSLGALPNGWWHKPNFLSSVYVNHNHFAGFLEMALPITLGLVISERDSAKRVLYIFLAAMMGMAFAMTLSRGGMISLTIALVFMVIFLMWRSPAEKSLLIFLALGALFGVVGLVFGFQPLHDRLWTLGNLGNGKEAQERILIWKGAFDLIRHYRWVGSGPGTFEFIFLHFRPENYRFRPVHVHNDYLEVLADGGFFLFFAAVVLFLVFFVKGLKILKENENHRKIGVGVGCLASFLAFAVHGLVDFNFHIPANLAWLVVLGAMLLSLGNEGQKSARRSGFLMRSVVSGLLLMVFVGSLFFGISDFLFSRAQSAWAKKSIPKTLSLLDAAILVNPFNAEYRDLRGYVRLKKGITASTKEAVLAGLDFETAIKQNPYEPYYDLHRAELAGIQNPTAGAMALVPYFQKALEKDAGDPKLYFLCAQKLFLLNTTKDAGVDEFAKSLLGRAVVLDPNNSYNIFELLWKEHPDILCLKAFQERYPQGIRAFTHFLERHHLEV